MTDVNYEIRHFDSSDDPPRADLASLHEKLLPHSPVALLGRGFMEDFYYRLLPKRQLTFGSVAYIDEIPVGFVVACTDSAGFMGKAIRRDWYSLMWTMTVSLVMKPSRIRAVWEAIQILKDVTTSNIPPGTGELLSLAVAPDYRTAEFNCRTGLNIASDLRRIAMEGLHSRAVKRVRTVVDADNLVGNIFYRADGWEASEIKPQGWSKPSIEYVKSFDALESITGDP